MLSIYLINNFIYILKRSLARELDGEGHTFKNGLIELVQDIKAIQPNNN